MPDFSVLIAEDDPALLALLVDLFRMEGYRTRTAVGGLEALRQLVGGAVPDLLLLDMHMEGLDAPGLAAELQTLRLQVPILLITGDPDPARCAATVGAKAYLAKPLDLQGLLKTVERLLDENVRRRGRR